LYVIDKGELDCFKDNSEGEKKLLKTYKPGEAFGELALLYNAPRAATIIANEDCTLFALDRQTFNHIVKDAASRKRDGYE
jgi:cAMP-dependent protein kinase regulator